MHQIISLCCSVNHPSNSNPFTILPSEILETIISGISSDVVSSIQTLSILDTNMNKYMILSIPHVRILSVSRIQMLHRFCGVKHLNVVESIVNSIWDVGLNVNSWMILESLTIPANISINPRTISRISLDMYCSDNIYPDHSPISIISGSTLDFNLIMPRLRILNINSESFISQTSVRVNPSDRK